MLTIDITGFGIMRSTTTTVENILLHMAYRRSEENTVGIEEHFFSVNTEQVAPKMTKSKSLVGIHRFVAYDPYTSTLALSKC